MPITNFRDLMVWQRSMRLAEAVYELTARFPERERYGLASQMRRAAVSIPSNVAEGQVRRTASFLNHLQIALGSEAELQTQLELASRINLIDPVLVRPVIDDAAAVGRMLRGLIASLRIADSTNN